MAAEPHNWQRVLTEDGHVVYEGDKVYDYYSMKPGVIDEGSMKPDGWFFVTHTDGGRVLLNGIRICSIEGAKLRKFPGA